jgi:hypothetical protein
LNDTQIKSQIISWLNCCTTSDTITIGQLISKTHLAPNEITRTFSAAGITPCSTDWRLPYSAPCVKEALAGDGRKGRDCQSL